MADIYKKRRTIFSLGLLIFLLAMSIVTLTTYPEDATVNPSKVIGVSDSILANKVLGSLKIQAKTIDGEYTRDKFGSGWATQSGCDTRNIILNRDLIDAVVDEKCNVISGLLNDPYSGKQIHFNRGSNTSDDVQIDHVVALSDAWHKGAQSLTQDQRIKLANDPLELLAVSGSENQQKSDGDAATWLPPNKPFRCQYVARQIAVKHKYGLWLTRAEFNAIFDVLKKCPNQLLPTK